MDTETINKSNERVIKRGEGRKVCQTPMGEKERERLRASGEICLVASSKPFLGQWTRIRFMGEKMKRINGNRFNIGPISAHYELLLQGRDEEFGDLHS